MQALQHEMQQPEHLAVGVVAARGGESSDLFVGAGERGLAQIQAGRETLDGAAHDALRVAGLDLAFDRHGELAERAIGGKGMGDVAEGVLVLVEPAIGGNVDPPARHILAVVVARSQPQHLDHAGRGLLVPVAGEVRDTQAHGGRQRT